MFLYKSAVTKHGSHNQQSHAGSRGKGGGGAGTGSTASGNSASSAEGKALSDSASMAVRVLGEDQAVLNQTARELTRKGFNADGARIALVSTQLGDARKTFKTALKLKEPKNQLKEMERAYSQLYSAGKTAAKIKSFEAQEALEQLETIPTILDVMQIVSESMAPFGSKLKGPLG